MGTSIDAVATSVKRGRLRGRGALHLTDAAATTCLHRAGRHASQLDLLINTGMYKDFSAAEPALASIIQEDIGANPGTTLDVGHGTFSFDILNGGCGVLTAAQLVDAFVKNGDARCAMIVAGDVDPRSRTSRHFPFSPAGGALLVTHAEGNTGFRDFEFRTFPIHAELFEVTLRWEPSSAPLHRGHNIVDVREAPEFAPRCTELATEVAVAFLARHELAPADIDLLITSQYPRMLAFELGPRLGITPDHIPGVRPELASAHTAGPIAALEVAYESGQLEGARRTLIVTVGAGITVGVALYESA